MEYSKLELFGFAFLGILSHIFIEIYKLNKQPNGNFNILAYFKVEIWGILVSLIASFASVFLSQSIAQVHIGTQMLGTWIVIPYMAVGYMGQSLLIALMGKAQKVVDQATQ